MQWEGMVQLIIEWIENDRDGSLTLLDISKRLGYSPYYCSRKFHQTTGMSIREYVTRRRISRAAERLRDSDDRIIDIAFENGFSSHEALTRAFVSAFGLSPKEYRMRGRPVPLFLRGSVSFDQINSSFLRRTVMNTKNEISVTIELIPETFFIGIRDGEASDYWDFWDKRGSCDEIVASLDSIIDSGLDTVPKLQLGGWYSENGKKGYLYGILVPADYGGIVPASCEKVFIPSGKYVCFRHGSYDYGTEENRIDELLSNAVNQYPLNEKGFIWDETRPTWQRHFPEEYGQSIVKPVVLTDNS